MHGTKQAAEVSACMYKGERATRGNASTDGSCYYLFGNKIVDTLGGPEELRVANRLKGYNPEAIAFTFAGWPTPSTKRHLETVVPFKFSLRRGKVVVHFRSLDLELEDDKWYTVHCLHDMFEERTKQ